MVTYATKVTHRDRIRFARDHLSPREYIDILSVPPWRRTQKIDMHAKPNPFGIAPAAKKCQASKRLKIMSVPKRFRPKYDPNTAARSRQPVIRASTLAATPSKRILELALPKESTVVHAKRFATNKLVKDFMEDIHQRIKSSRYQKYRVVCNTLRKRSLARRRKLIERRVLKPEEWSRHAAALERIARPKVVPKAKPLFAKKWRPPNMRRVRELAMPSQKGIETPKNPWVVTQSALRYEISPRMELIARRHFTVRPLPQKIPGTVSRPALSYQATPRILILARPLERRPGMETDVKENAFQVSPTALKARCSKRLKNLAVARVRT